jgi:hypothetical protein
MCGKVASSLFSSRFHGHDTKRKAHAKFLKGQTTNFTCLYEPSSGSTKECWTLEAHRELWVLQSIPGNPGKQVSTFIAQQKNHSNSKCFREELNFCPLKNLIQSLNPAVVNG